MKSAKLKKWLYYVPLVPMFMSWKRTIFEMPENAYSWQQAYAFLLLLAFMGMIGFIAAIFR